MPRLYSHHEPHAEGKLAYLPLVVEPDFLNKELADRLLEELREDARKNWKSDKVPYRVCALHARMRAVHHGRPNVGRHCIVHTMGPQN